MADAMGERILPDGFSSKEEYILYLRHLFAYEFAKNIIPKDSRVLEIGSGEGYGTFMLSSNVTHIVGLDVSNKVIEHSLKKYRRENCVFNMFDGFHIPYLDNSFDAAVSFQVIEHVADDKNYVHEIHRVLKNGGVFILTTPNRIHRLRPGQKPWNRFHVREYYHQELKALLKEKFSDVKIFGVCGNDEIQQIEINRVKPGAESYLPLWIKDIVPPSVKNFMRNMLKGNNKAEGTNFLTRYSVHDYHAVESDIDSGLDFLSVCKK